MSAPVPPAARQPHEMTLLASPAPRTDEWLCPTCGRRFVLRWPPDYGKVVLDRGDEHAVHVGGKGGVSMRPVQVSPALDARPTRSVDSWRRWLEEHGIDWDGAA